MASRKEDEDRILRVWTPVILRVSLLSSSIILIAGLAIIGYFAPQYYVERFHQLQQPGATFPHESLLDLLSEASMGAPRQVLMVGLLVLTLVPLGRVAFTLIFFIKERDGWFIVLTATVLSLLILGVVCGRVG
jgi:uncharacterized membrane protein